LYVPDGVVLAVCTVTLTATVPELTSETEFEPKAQVVLAGNPVQERETVPAKPFIEVNVILYVVFCPAFTVCVTGLGVIEKSVTL
jgi:hypothetical protein